MLWCRACRGSGEKNPQAQGRSAVLPHFRLVLPLYLCVWGFGTSAIPHTVPPEILLIGGYLDEALHHINLCV